MANIRLATAVNNAACDAVVDLIDAGAVAGIIQMRTGTQPATANLAASGTLIGTLLFSDPAFGAAVAGVASAAGITDDSSADADGTITWARILDSNSNTVFDCDVTAVGGGGTIELNTPIVVTGQTISIASFTMTHPSGV